MSLVSIVIPTHNRATYLIRAIQSVLNQTFTDLEVIVVDDGSTDNTAQLVRALGDSRLYLVQQSQQERATARNTGFGHARSEFIAFLDDDDLWKPTMVESALKGFDRHEVGVVYSSWRFIDGSDHVLPQAARRPGKRGAVLRDLLFDFRFPTSAALIRRASMEQVGEFDRELVPVEDWDLWIRLAARGSEFEFVSEPLLLYRLHDQNSTKALEQVERGARKLFDKTFAGLDGAYADARREALARLDFRSAVKRFGIGQAETGTQLFVGSVSALPSLLEELPTYYQIICAMQPDGYKGTNERMDLALGRQYIERVLSASFSNDSALRSRGGRAYSHAYLTLARLHYGRREMTDARYYMGKAIQHNPRLVASVNLWGSWGKTFVPPPTLARLKKLRTASKEMPV